MKKALLLFVLASTFSLAVFAQDTEQKDAVQPQSQDMTHLNMGFKLARYGYENHSAISLMDAARIIGTVSTQAYEGQPDDRGDDVTPTDAKQTSFSYEPHALLEEALRLAGDDAHLMALIEQTREEVELAASPSRGRVPGYRSPCSSSTVAANSWVAYTVNGKADTLVECAVVGDGDTDLDLYVYDENNNLITKDDENNVDLCYVCWVPRWTGSFTIKIVNRGNVYNRYQICILN